MSVEILGKQIESAQYFIRNCSKCGCDYLVLNVNDRKNTNRIKCTCCGAKTHEYSTFYETVKEWNDMNGKNKYWAEIRWDKKQGERLQHIQKKRDLNAKSKAELNIQKPNNRT